VAGVLSCAADNAMNLQFHVQVTGINLEWLDLIANLLNNAFFSLLRTHAMSEDILLIIKYYYLRLLKVMVPMSYCYFLLRSYIFTLKDTDRMSTSP